MKGTDRIDCLVDVEVPDCEELESGVAGAPHFPTVNYGMSHSARDA